MATKGEAEFRRVETEREILELRQQADRLVSQLQAAADRGLVGAQTVKASIDAADGVHEQGTLDKIKTNAQGLKAKMDDVLASVDSILAL